MVQIHILELIQIGFVVFTIWFIFIKCVFFHDGYNKNIILLGFQSNPVNISLVTTVQSI